MANIIGIDVGMTGAIALYDGCELLIWDMPIYKTAKTKRLSPHQILEILKLYPIEHAYIEQVNAFGMGVSSAYNFGYGCGVIEACVASCEIPYTYVTPQKWKKALSCQKEKDSARMRASQLFPNFSYNWDRKKDDGRAEASMIAYYGFNKGVRE